MNKKQIELFNALVSEKSIGKAAELLHLTTAAVSKGLMNLEADLKHSLFKRSQTGLTLTQKGKEIYKELQPLLKEWRRFDAAISDLNNKTEQTLSVLVFSSLCRFVLSQRLLPFHLSYPNIKLDIEFSETLEDMRDSQYDVMLGFRNVDHLADNFRYKKICQIEKVLCASAKLLKEYGDIKAEEDVINFPYLGHPIFKPNTEIFLRNGGSIPCQAPILTMNDFYMLNQLCIQSMGLLLSSNCFAKPYFITGQLVRCLPDIKFKQFDIFLYYRDAKFDNQALKTFVEFFSQEAYIVD